LDISSFDRALKALYVEKVRLARWDRKAKRAIARLAQVPKRDWWGRPVPKPHRWRRGKHARG